MTKYTAEYWDHRRDLAKHEPRPEDRRRLAVASLVGECESLVGSGLLAEPAEQSLRVLIAETLSAFQMQPHERAL